MHTYVDLQLGGGGSRGETNVTIFFPPVSEIGRGGAHSFCGTTSALGDKGWSFDGILKTLM